MKINAYYPNYFFDYAITGAAYHIVKGMQLCEHEIHLMGLASIPTFNDAFYKNAIPKWARSLTYQIFPSHLILKAADAVFCSSVKPNEVAYLWPSVSLATYKRLKARGCIIVHECVNTHQVNSKAILDKAYAELSLPLTTTIKPEDIENEFSKLQLVDYLYSCSPAVTQSMLDNGIPANKILPTSYGLSHKAILNNNINLQKNEQPIFIFVGSISVRKGVHLLLDYWVKAKLKAKLQLVGVIEEAIKPLVNKYLSEDNIEHIPFTDDLSRVFSHANVFVLPSLEEGSPLVTYMAFGGGLPLLVSPMGGGGVVTDGVEGIVIDPYDGAQWIERLQNLAQDADLRAELGKNSRLAAPYYLWDAVAKRRLDVLTKAIGQS